MSAKVDRSPSSSATPTGTHPHHDHARNAHHKEALRLALGSILAPKRPYTPISRSSSGSATPVHNASDSRSADSSHLHQRQAPHPHLHHSHHPSSSSRFSRPELTTTPPGMTPSFSQHHFPYFTVHPHTTSSSPAQSNPDSGTTTPEAISTPGSTAGSPPLVHSPGPSIGQLPVPMSVPEEEPLQLLPPIVAAGSATKSSEEPSSSISARPVQPVHPCANGRGEHTAADHCNKPHYVYHDKSHHSRGDGGATTPRAGFIETLQNKNNAWDALIHGSFS